MLNLFKPIRNQITHVLNLISETELSTSNDITLLFQAIETQDQRAIELLLQSPQLLKKIHTKNNKALRLAAKMENIDLIQHLLNFESVSTFEVQNKNALSIAVENLHYETARRIFDQLKHFYQQNDAEPYGLLFPLAVDNNDEAFIQEILERAHTHQWLMHSPQFLVATCQALNQAAFAGQFERMQLLARTIPNPNINIQRQTFLSKIIQSGLLAHLQWGINDLTPLCANRNEQSELYHCAFQYSLEFNQIEMIEWLLSQEILEESFQHHGRGPISNALTCGSNELIELVLSSQIVQRHLPNCYEDCLNFHVEKGEIEKVKKLLEYLDDELIGDWIDGTLELALMDEENGIASCLFNNYYIQQRTSLTTHPYHNEGLEASKSKRVKACYSRA